MGFIFWKRKVSRDETQSITLRQHNVDFTAILQAIYKLGKVQKGSLIDNQNDILEQNRKSYPVPCNRLD